MWTRDINEEIMDESGDNLLMAERGVDNNGDSGDNTAFSTPYRVEDEKDNGGIEPLGGDGNESTELEQVLQTNFSNVLNARPLSSAQMRKRNKKNVRDALFHNFIAAVRSQGFKKRECVTFIANEDEPQFCMCGRLIQEHYEHKKLLKQGAQSEKWESLKHSKEFPTDAFGEIHFEGTAENKTAKYLRVASDTDVGGLVDFAVQHWRLPQPKMVISITGGAGHLKMDKKLIEGLKKGLMKVAVSTGAWIVTGGTNAGIMKLCGEAVHDYILAHGERDNSVVTIGVATWGIITNRKQLISGSGSKGEGKFPAEYSRLTEEEKKEIERKRPLIQCYLDPNHTHFVLVDDGTENQFGKEMGVRASFEAEICKGTRDGNLLDKSSSDKGESGPENTVSKVPIVCVMVEGGPGTLDTARSALKENTPVVIVDGSGRCADAIAFVYNKTRKRNAQQADPNAEYEYILDPQEEQAVQNKVFDLLGMKDDEKGMKLFKDIMEVVQNRSYITVFKLNGRSTTTRDIDIAILKSLLSVSSDKYEQLKLALAWNRLDIAKSEIFSDQSQAGSISVAQLQELMKRAVLESKVPFIQLFIANGVVLRNWLTPRILTEIYRRSFVKSSFMRKYVNQKLGSADQFKLKVVGDILRSFMGANFTSQYFDPAIDDLNGKYDTCFPNAAKELFIYSLLLMRYTMMRFFWEEGTEQIAAALFASTVLRRIAAHPLLRNDVEQQEKLNAHADEYEELSIGILNQCHEDNDEQTQKILIREQPSFGKLTCIDLAVVADSKRFIAQTGCQSLLNSIWNGRMQPYNSRTSYLLALFCPPLVLTHIYFTNDSRADDSKAANSEAKTIQAAVPLAVGGGLGNSKTADGVKQPLRSTFNDITADNTVTIGRTSSKLNPAQKLIKFYSAPITKFALNFITYLIFLCIYSVFVLNQYHLDKMNWYEGLLCVWVFSFALEEFRQLIIEESERMRKKLMAYVTSFWNLLDLAGLALFLTGLVLRIVSFTTLVPTETRMEIVEWAHTLYVFALVIYYIRLTHACSISQELGPKVIMIAKMIQDLIFFMFILFVFLISYGVALQAIMFPNEKSWKRIFQGVFYYPYWQMFGELFLDEIGEEISERCVVNATTGKSVGLAPGTAFGDAEPDVLYCDSTQYVNLVTVLLAAFYLFFTNIVLINLLIAMFTYTFEQVQERTDLFWKFHLYELIKEYFQRPALPPPLILLQHFYFFIRMFLGCFTDKVKVPNYTFKMKIKESPVIQQLIKWEDLNAEEYLRELDRDERETLEYRVKQAEKNTSDILNAIVDPMTGEERGSLAERVSHLESQFDTVSKQLDYVNVMMQYVAKVVSKDKNAPPIPLPPPDLFSSTVAEGYDVAASSVAVLNVQPSSSKPPPITDDNKLKASTAPQLNANNLPAQTKKLTHVKALTLNYYEMKRFQVPSSLIPWDKVWYEYDPPVYTHPIVLEGPAWADVDLLKPENDSYKSVIPWNKLDSLKKVDRRSFMGSYSLGKDDLLPRNPIGRTGLRGRGLLGRWGPNHAADPVVTRWRRDGNGSIILKKDKPLLEFVAITRKDTGDVAIPGGMVDPGEEVTATLLREFAEETMSSGSVSATLRALNKSDKMAKIKELFFNHGTEIYRGYVDDPRNTDNAWMETVVVNFHDDSGVMKDSLLKAGDDAKTAFWQEISSGLNMYANHAEFIRKTAELHGAFF